MVDILEILQNQYVPKVNGEPADHVFFGGDELTEERARNIQKARSDGETTSERLDEVWPKNEDWHAIRIAYQVLHASCFLFKISPCVCKCSANRDWNNDY